MSAIHPEPQTPDAARGGVPTRQRAADAAPGRIRDLFAAARCAGL